MMLLRTICSISVLMVASLGHAAEPGAAKYSLSCAACHQLNGKGIPRAFPSIVGAPSISGDSKNLINLILRGRGGMPPLAAELTDADIVAIIGYIRGSWGNNGDPVAVEEVAAERLAAKL